MNEPSVFSGTENRERLLAGIVDACLRDIEENRQPHIDKYLAQYPELADELNALLPALCALGQFDHISETGGAKAAPLVDPSAPTARLGDFLIRRELGRGGMGVVYEALQVSLNRRVALKVLPFASVLEPTDIQRFKNEAQIAAQLHHPHIVPVHAVGCENGVHYYAMQLIEGQTLAQLIRRLARPNALGPPIESSTVTIALPGHTPSPHPRPSKPPARGSTARGQQEISTAVTSLSRSDKKSFQTIARWGIQAAEGLHYAHSLGMVHRDVKPSNLLLDNQGKLWVADFGLAKVSSGPQLTLTGDLVGTIAYMSPEQTGTGGVVDHRSDIYSLGATLYELAGLRRVFTSNNRLELLKQVATAEPKPLRQVNKHVPIDLETIIHKAISKDSNARYNTAQEMAQDLQRFLEARPIRARRPSLADRAGKWVHRHRILVASLAAVLLLTTFGSLVSAGLILSAKNQTDSALAEAKSQKTAAEEALEGQRAALAAAQKQEAAALVSLERERAALFEAQAQTDFAQQAIDDLYVKMNLRWMRESPPRTHVEGEFMQKALEYYAHLAELQGEDEDSMRQQAIIYYQIGNMYLALELYEDAHENYEYAIALLEELLIEKPDSFGYHKHLALCYVRHSHALLEMCQLDVMEVELNRAGDLIRRLQISDPTNWEVTALAMRFDLCAGRFHAAYNEAEQARERFALVLEWQLPQNDVDKLFEGLELQVQACKEFSALSNEQGRPREALGFVQQARGYLTQAKAAVVIPWISFGMERDLDRAEALSLAALGRYEEALELALHAHDTSAELLKYYGDVELYASYIIQDLILMCELCVELDNHKQAVLYAKPAYRLHADLIAKKPEVLGYRLNYARLLLVIGRMSNQQHAWETAKKSFFSSHELSSILVDENPSRSDCSYQRYLSSLEYIRFLTLVPEESLRDYPLAESLCQTALNDFPHDRRGYRMLAILLYRGGVYDEAITHLEHTDLEVGPFTTESHLIMAMSHHELGNVNEALDHYEAARTAYSLAREHRDFLGVALFREAEQVLGIPSEAALPEPPAVEFEDEEPSDDSAVASQETTDTATEDSGPRGIRIQLPGARGAQPTQPEK